MGSRTMLYLSQFKANDSGIGAESGIRCSLRGKEKYLKYAKLAQLLLFSLPNVMGWGGGGVLAYARHAVIK